MERTDFETLRDLPGKVIGTDIKFSRRQATSPAMVAEQIVIQNDGGVDLKLNITFNPEVGSKTFNVYAVGVGPVCRLDVDGPAHRPAGRSHKHSLQSGRCPDRNLPDEVIDRPDLAGKRLEDVFVLFCEMAQIVHQGTFLAPSEA